jgi:plasmid stabilization system protein ParE
MSTLKIIWSDQARRSLKEIHARIKPYSEQGAKNVKHELLSAPKKIIFAKQYQVDDINPRYRRIVVRDYKILYRERDGVVQVIDIICTLQTPDILRNK